MEVKTILLNVIEDKAAIDVENHRIEAVVSSEIVDRDNERVLADAVLDAIRDKKTFAANPQCLACHQHRLSDGNPPTIGKWEPDTSRIVGKKVQLWLQFAAGGYDLAAKYWYLYSNRFMRAFSIGFRTIDGREIIENGKRIYEITKIELVEISCCAVGANQEALAKQSLLDAPGDADARIKAAVAAESEKLIAAFTEKLSDIETAMASQFEEIKSLLISDPDGLAAALLGERHDSPAGGDKDISELLASLKRIETQFTQEK